ncbi:CmpA/NrtA family ABC transporter substrate-binding protein [Flavobacterium gawalongense]|uniref:ABC transporter substrate-binding protein n=1 Tax=Flavobacterium gawalongense TaxID=2594432 RepID=A0A553BI60_9FLAO|nr:CmpA/NrtA family ABC transporter substrate-binding protein [Flavobacterium gawalongense]TRX00207.1 ABC transporter substrate-binding protein [Flavobacterium gawalongense]TRX04965.1 ABC transporter substrate-binding protein [Flavobacterium gawalongense]TRX07941.1 ABC transporter substrate-binding protein [Flavobacterium gawalongense]TRX08642.1 ABC transporter substrate-binding protein [Flavobacterium gawalongense]TRX24578.1 ABC transporter substrate-binding protein [Flavobacterium gawalongen
MKNSNKQITRGFKTAVLTLLIVLSSAFTTISAQSDPVRLGFIPLTDCSPIVMAKELGLFKKYGVEVIVTKESSWANVRDKILTGELDGAHCLYSMPFSVYTGVGGKAGSEMKIAMMLNVNGQAITLSNDFCGKVGFKQMNKVTPVVAAKLKAEKEVTFAMTFPGGTHDLWLRNWMSIAGLNQKSVKIITIPPPQMVANMKVGNMDGYCVGEPWGGVAVKQGIGFTQVASQDIWKDHPEKALVVNKDFSAKRKADLVKVMKAVMEACIWLDNPSNRKKAAAIIGRAPYVNAPADVIEARLMGDYNLGCNQGTQVYSKDYMLFHKGGMVNYPRKSYAIWAMAQYVRFGYLKEAPNYAAIADKLILQDLYEEVAKSMKVKVPNDDMKPFSLTMDKTVFDPSNPEAYLKVVKR